MATLLPNGKQQFFDANGNPLANGTVGFYVPGTLDPKDTWQDSNQDTLNTNPVQLDAGGWAIIYGSGIYRQIVEDIDGNLIWDQLTADTATGGLGWGGVSSGTDNAQVIAPSNFTSQDGQQISFIAGLTNTSQLTVNGIPVLLDTGSGPQPLSGGEVVENNVVTLIYDAVRGAFHIINPVADGETITYLADATGAVARSVSNRLDDQLTAFDFLTAAQRAAVGAGTVVAGLGTALQAAFAAAMSSKRTLLINRGTWLVDPFEGSGNLDFGFYLNSMIDVQGEGVDQTIIKNTNTICALIRCGGGFPHRFGGMTLDNNGSSKNAFQQGGQGSVTRDLLIKNQVGTGWAIVIDGSNYVTLDNVTITDCVRGIDVGPNNPMQYMTWKGVRIESDTDSAGNAIALRMNATSNSKLDVYVDGGDTGLGYSRTNLVLITNCQGVDFQGLGTEVADGGMTAPGFVEIQASRTINFFGGRAFISADAPTGKAMFALTGQASEGILVEGFDWRVEKDNSYFFFEDTITSGTPKNFSIRNISGLVSATGCQGVFLEVTPVPQNILIENFQTTGSAITHYLGGIRQVLVNIPQNVTVPVGGGGYFINQTGTLTDPGGGVVRVP